jgi:hypothetical protein
MRIVIAASQGAQGFADSYKDVIPLKAARHGAGCRIIKNNTMKGPMI